MKSRFLAELTTPEIEKYLEDGGCTAILPVGSVEMHGPHLPMGTDTLIAKAFAVRLAEEADGLVLPEVHYTWAGATDGFAGTVSIDMELVTKTLEAIFVKVAKMGFKRLVTANYHGPNEQIVYLFARQFYEKYLIPVMVIDVFKPMNDEIGEIFQGVYEKSSEASVLLGALKILGKTDLYPEEEMCYEDDAPKMYTFDEIRKCGKTGFMYQDIRQHTCPSVYTSGEKGVEYINKQVNCALPALKRLGSYASESMMQKNQGWWK